MGHCGGPTSFAGAMASRGRRGDAGKAEPDDEELVELKDLEKYDQKLVSVVGFVYKCEFVNVRAKRSHLKIILGDHSGIRVEVHLWEKLSSTPVGLKDLVLLRKMNVKRFRSSIELQSYFTHTFLDIVLSGKWFLDPTNVSSEIKKKNLKNSWIQRINFEFEHAKRNACTFFNDFLMRDYVFDDLDLANMQGIFQLRGKVFEISLFSERNASVASSDPSSQMPSSNLSSSCAPRLWLNSKNEIESISPDQIAEFLFCILQHRCLFCAGECLLGACECDGESSAKKWVYRPICMLIGSDTFKIKILVKNMTIEKLFHGISAQQLWDYLCTNFSQASESVETIVDTLDSLIQQGEDDYHQMVVMLNTEKSWMKNELIDLT